MICVMCQLERIGDATGIGLRNKVDSEGTVRGSEGELGLGIWNKVLLH